MSTPALHQISSRWREATKPFRERDYPRALDAAFAFICDPDVDLLPNHFANIYYNIAESAYYILLASDHHGDAVTQPEWNIFLQAVDDYLRIVEQGKCEQPDEGWWQIPNFPTTLLNKLIKLLLDTAQTHEVEFWTCHFMAIWPELTLHDVLFKAINAERINVVRPAYLDNTQYLAQLYLRLTESLPSENYCHPRVLVMNMLADLTYFIGSEEGENQALAWLDKALKINPNDQFARQRRKDIRDRKQVMEQIRRFNHDANTAIAGLLSNLQNLQQQRLPESAAILVEKLRLGFQRIHGVHRSVQRQQAQFITIPLRQTVERLILAYADQAQFTLNGGENGARLETDPDYFQSVLEKLLDNAIEACERNGISHAERHIRIQLESARKRILIEDNAGGIDPRLADRIFEPYVSSKAIKQTTGLGLSNARDIMGLLDGRLTLTDPQPVGGASFTIQF